MQKYCEGDTLVTVELYKYLIEQKLDPRCHELEHEFALVMAQQETFGFPFNEKAAYALVNTLKARRSELEDQLQATFPPIEKERWSEKTGKQLKTKVTVFNAASRQQTAERLKSKYPEITFESTEKGSPKVDDDVLELLGQNYPEAKLLAEYQLFNKRLGQIAEGKEAWLKHCKVYNDGRIHGEVITNACISGRCSHKRPNMAQVPSVGHAFGDECRALFHAPDGWLLVGTDASGLELRALGSWLAYFDDGEYARLVSTEGLDIHTYNAKLFGIYDGVGEISKATRDLSKRLIYCILYGGGAKKTGSIISPDESTDTQYKQGKKTIDTFYSNLPAIKKLKDLIEERITQRGYLTGIDGRRLQIRSKHSALNQLLQSTGAIAVKKATTILYDDLANEGLVFAGVLGVSPFANLSCTEEYNGTSWTAGGALITARSTPGGAGTQNAGLVFGGASPGRITCTEEYNGTTWAVGGALITPIFANSGAGTQTSALSFGGTTGTNVFTTNTEEYSANPFDRLLVGGTFTTYSGSTQRGSVMIRESGSRDTTFVIGSGFETAVDVKDFLINTDNSIIAVGGFTTYSASFSPQPNRIIKIRANGSIDASIVRNRWSKLAERSDGSAAGAGATIALFYITSSYLIYPGTTITATMTASVTARAATGWVYGTDTSAIAYTGSVTSSQTSDIGLLTLYDLTSGSGEYLFVRGVAIEDDNATLVMTPTPNFSTMSSAGTTGGTAITNQSVRSEFRIITTASLASFPTSSANTSNASIYFTFYETVIPRRRTYFILLD
jgi:hypothetical protein